jgi:hypothetical protein
LASLGFCAEGFAGDFFAGDFAFTGDLAMSR